MTMRALVITISVLALAGNAVISRQTVPTGTPTSPGVWRTGFLAQQDSFPSDTSWRDTSWRDTSWRDTMWRDSLRDTTGAQAKPKPKPKPKPKSADKK